MQVIVEQNGGQQTLKKIECDNAAAETSLMHSLFPDLLADVEPYVENGLGILFDLDLDGIAYVTTNRGLRIAGLAVQVCKVLYQLQEHNFQMVLYGWVLTQNLMQRA